MRILVTFAVEAEFAPWRRLRDLHEVKIGDVPAYQAQIGRAQVDFVITGIGMENARRTTEAILELGKTKTLLCSRNLAHAARDDGAKWVNMFLTSNQVASTAEEKKQLAPFADAVEMESFAIVSAAQRHKKAVVAIRVISDSALHDVPAGVNTMVDENGQVKIAGVVRYVARHPLQLPALIRLGRDSKTAAEALAHFLEAFIKKLSFSSHGWPPAELQEVAAR